MSRPEPILYKTNADARIDNTTDPTSWVDWIDARISANNEGIGEAIGEYCGQQVAPLKRELELLRREVNQLREQIGLERELKALRDQIKAAKDQVPDFPKIAERLEAGQSRLRREVADAKEKLGSLRVDASLTNHRLAELSTARVIDKTKLSERLDELRQANEATEAKIEIIFPRHKIHPAAGAALRNAADDALRGQTLYCFEPSMFEAPDAEPAASAPEETT
jgi:predicted  nucleic acid-binding Zn-ribbon protein